MAESVDGVVADIPETKKAVIAYRRCIILAIVGSTPADSQALGRIVSSGFLSTVKFWLDQILNGSVGELSWISSFQLSPSVLHRHAGSTYAFSRNFVGSTRDSRRSRPVAPLTYKYSQITSNKTNCKGVWHGESSWLNRKAQDLPRYTK